MKMGKTKAKIHLVSKFAIENPYERKEQGEEEEEEEEEEGEGEEEQRYVFFLYRIKCLLDV